MRRPTASTSLASCRRAGRSATRALRSIAASPRAQVLFEAPHRIVMLADALAELCGVRRLTVCRELTKQFETVVSFAANELPDWLRANANHTRGEFVLVLHAAPVREDNDGAQADHVLQILLRELSLKQAVALAAQITQASRNALYARALALQRDQTS